MPPPWWNSVGVASFAPDNAPVGDYAEWLLAHTLAGHLAGSTSAKSYDVTLPSPARAGARRRLASPRLGSTTRQRRGCLDPAALGRRTCRRGRDGEGRRRTRSTSGVVARATPGGRPRQGPAAARRRSRCSEVGLPGSGSGTPGPLSGAPGRPPASRNPRRRQAGSRWSSGPSGDRATLSIGQWPTAARARSPPAVCPPRTARGHNGASTLGPCRHPRC